MPICIFPVMLLFTLFNTPDKTAQEEPVKIIFDTDMGSDCDDAGALALLHVYAGLGKAEIIGCVYSSGRVPFGAGVVQAINVYYGRPEIPVGACHNDDIGDPVDKMSAEKLARDTAAYGNSIVHNRDAIEQTVLNRKLLSCAQDNSITYVTVGHTRALYELLISDPDSISPLNGFELVRKKISRWIALGALGSNNENKHFVKNWNFFFNGTAPYTEYLIHHFPCPVYFVDAGSEVFTGRSLKYTPAGNIVRTAYRDWLWNYENKTLDDQRPSWDLATVYFAVEGTGPFLANEGKGWLEFDAEKGCLWHAEPGKRDQTYISQRKNVSDKFARYLNSMIGAMPETMRH